MINLINANSPMTFDATMLGALKVYARHNQACIVTPFILAGAMAPVTPVGVMTQTLAEALAGLSLTQLIRPGAPAVLGSFASSMRSEEHTSELQSLMRISYAVFCLKKKNAYTTHHTYD